jgi:hypothetical protein
VTEVYHHALRANSEVVELAIKVAATASFRFSPDLLFGNYQSALPLHFQLLSCLLDHRAAYPGKVYTFVHSTDK